MEHFTVDQTCKHGGCEMAIRFVIFMNRLAKPANLPSWYYKHSCMPNTPTNQPSRWNNHLCLLRCDLPTSLNALQDVLTVLIQFQLRDDDLGWVNADWHRLAR
jgi:hypothetical protein